MYVLHIGSSNLVQWSRMTDPSTNHYVNLATCSFTLYDSSGVAVAGCSDVSMPNVSGSDGVYQGWVPASAPLTSGARYVVQITAVWGTTNKGVRRILCVAQYRGAE